MLPMGPVLRLQQALAEGSITVEDILKSILISDIQDSVARAFHLSRAELLSPSRRQRVTYARHIAMYLSRELAGYRAKLTSDAASLSRTVSVSFPRIGIAFARNHSSVIHAYNSIERRRHFDVKFARLLDSLAHDVRNRAIARGPMEAA
jgi:chromosomal replication initiator protein